MSSEKRKVFGIGLNKTGTKTLGSCLIALGYRHQSYSGKALDYYLGGNTRSLLGWTDNYDSFEDWPWPLIWKALYRKYGDAAKYILTTRSSSDVWVDSLKKHSLNTHPTKAMRPLIYGYYYPHGYELQHKAFYEHHNRAVRAFFR